MAIKLSQSSLCFLLTNALFFFHLCICNEFQAGEIKGWVVPPGNDTDFYNTWASGKRFQVGDIIRFRYGKKDSVMEVSKRDYDECYSMQPSYFSNSGDTLYVLNGSGFFYFISGTAGQCQKGQRMVVWVLKQQNDRLRRSSGVAGEPCDLLAALAMIIAAATVAAAFQFN